MKRSRPLAIVVGLGILLAGLAAQAAPQQASTFTNQCDGDAFRIDLAELLDVELGQDDEERIEQLRDWIWQILLGRLEATTDLEDLLMGSATQPLVRDDALAHVLDHPVGSTRSVTAKGGEVVVMLEQGDPAEMHEALLEAVDQEALSVGATPEDVVAYRYIIDERTGYADLCRIGTFHPAWIESPQQGFRRQTVRSASALASFLDGGVDLLTAQCTAQGLELTGRTRSRARKAPITVEHIAALQQEPEAGYISYVPSEKLGLSLDDLSDEWRAQLAISATLIERAAILQMFQMEPWIIFDDLAAKAYEQIRDWQRQHPIVPTEALLLSWYMQNEPREPGFSLDPKIRAKDVVRSLEALIVALDDPGKLATLLYSWNVEPSHANGFIASVGIGRELLKQGLLTLRDTLSTSSDADALGLLMRARSLYRLPGFALTGAAARFLHEHDGYQCARYDGPLQGTLTGMTMFYTDLLMKLWANDQFDVAPEGLIAGFESSVGHAVSSAYCTEDEQHLGSTRAWLGLREEQYVREHADQSRFAPVVTRVFARSSMYGSEYSEETEVTAVDRHFYQWWNANYARVAAWEPQYELLNQIMKWSVVVQASAISEHGDCMAFLGDTPVTRSHRFERWVEDQKDLSWRGPVPLVGRDDEATECLPLLRSRWFPYCGAETYWSGGVSTARRMDVASKPLWSAEVAPQLRRFGTTPAVKPTVLGNGRATYGSVAKAEGKLHDVVLDPGRRRFTARIDTGTSQRGARHTWLMGGERGGQPVTKVDKSWKFQDGALEGRATINEEFGVAHLHVADVTQAVARPQVTRLSAVQARTLAQEAATRLSSGKTSLDKIATDMPGVSKAWHNGDTVLVKIAGPGGGPPRYALMSAKGIRGPPGSVVGRFGARNASKVDRSVEISMVDESQAFSLKDAHQLTEIPTGGPVTKLHKRLETSLAKGDIGEVRQIIGEMRTVDPASHASIRNVIARARLRALRLGKDARPFEKLLLENSIARARPLGSAQELNVLPVDSTSFYVPRPYAKQYAGLAALPQGKNPLTAPGSARASFHAQVIDEAATLRQPPSVIRYDGVEYVRIDRSGAAAVPRLGRTYVLLPCRSTDDEARGEDTVPCHGRTSGREVDEAHRQYLLRQACQGDAHAWAFGVNGCQQLRDRERVSLRGRR
jgi:hypothetical protein